MTGRAPFRGRYGRLRLRGPRSRSASAPRLRPANVPFGPLPVFRHSGVVRQAASSLKRGASAGSAFVSSLGGSPAAFAAAMRPFMGPPTTGDPRRSGGFLAAAYGARQKLR
jgi:hypothetical protein